MCFCAFSTKIKFEQKHSDITFSVYCESCLHLLQSTRSLYLPPSTSLGVLNLQHCTAYLTDRRFNTNVTVILILPLQEAKRENLSITQLIRHHQPCYGFHIFLLIFSA